MFQSTAFHLTLIIISTADLPLGRFDYESLSEQTLMELLVTPLSQTNNANFTDFNGNFTDIKEWNAVFFDTDDHVTAISWQFPWHSESTGLDLKWIPPHVKNFSYQHSMTNIDFSPENLPSGLTYLKIRAWIGGPVDFKVLTLKLNEIHLQLCAISGTCDLEHLPKDLQILNIDSNEMSGSLCFGKLPTPLKVLRAGNNSFSGDIVLDALPAQIEKIELHNNKFDGCLRLVHVAHILKEFTVSVEFNALQGTAVVAKSIREGSVYVNQNMLSAVVDENGEVHALQKEFLAVQKKPGASVGAVGGAKYEMYG